MQVMKIENDEQALINSRDGLFLRSRRLSEFDVRHGDVGAGGWVFRILVVVVDARVVSLVM